MNSEVCKKTINTISDLQAALLGGGAYNQLCATQKKMVVALKTFSALQEKLCTLTARDLRAEETKYASGIGGKMTNLVAGMGKKTLPDDAIIPLGADTNACARETLAVIGEFQDLGRQWDSQIRAFDAEIQTEFAGIWAELKGVERDLNKLAEKSTH